jgi:hypothetical protein
MGLSRCIPNPDIKFSLAQGEVCVVCRSLRPSAFRLLKSPCRVRLSANNSRSRVPSNPDVDRLKGHAMKTKFQYTDRYSYQDFY